LKSDVLLRRYEEVFSSTGISAQIRGTIYGLTFGNAASENGSGRTQN